MHPAGPAEHSPHPAGRIRARTRAGDARRRLPRPSSAAAIALNADLVDGDVRNAVRDLDHDILPRPTTNAHLTEPASPPANPNPAASSRAAAAGPPAKHQLALMIWLAAFPTLTVLNLALGDWLGTLTPVVRRFVLAPIAVPIVIYGLMPQLHRLRRHLLTRIASS